MEIRRFVEFEDRKGSIQLLPYIKDTVDEIELRCIDVDCVDSKSISCSKCPLSLQNEMGLFEGEFKILESEEIEGGK